MIAKNSFLILLRLVFLLFSLQFLKDAFYKWDGYSYYMHFIDFLPELSLVFVIWSIYAVILAFVLWLIIYVIFKVIPKSLIDVSLEQITAVFVFIAVFILLPLFIKRTYFSHISISNFIGLSRLLILIILGVVAAFTLWFVRKHIGKITEKVLYWLDSRITPLVWLFAVLFIIAIPLSVIKKGPPHTKNITGDSANVASQKIGDGSNTGSNHNDRPNIIIVTLDSLYAGDMQLYGYERPTTPFLTEWAKDAIVFNKVYAASNFTTPTTMSLLTGQRVWTHRVWYDVHYHSAPHYENSLPGVLRDNGYDVYAFVQNDWAHPDSLGIGDAFSLKDSYFKYHIPSDWWFEKFLNFFVKNRPIADKWLKNNFIYYTIENYHDDVYTTSVPTELVFNHFSEYISQRQQKRSQRPFFAYLHVYPPHFLYLPPRPYSGLFGDADKYNSVKKQWSNFNFNAEYAPGRQKDVDILRKRYDEFILYCDKQFELLISYLVGAIDTSNTIIIFASDHGQSFSHSYLAHRGPHLYESLVHIPLIIKIPGETGGRIIDMPVEQIDIAPTILELVGLPVQEWIEGRSLLPLLKGKFFKPQPIFSMTFRRNRLLGHPITKGTVAIWDGEYKLVHYLEDKKTLLFNLRSDPDETQNIFHEKPDIAKNLIKLINNNLSNANKKIENELRKQSV